VTDRQIDVRQTDVRRRIMPPPRWVGHNNNLKHSDTANLLQGSHYLCQAGYVFISICVFVSRIMQKLLSKSHKIRWKDGTWAKEDKIKIWWEFGSGFRNL